MFASVISLSLIVNSDQLIVVVTPSTWRSPWITTLPAGPVSLFGSSMILPTAVRIELFNVIPPIVADVIDGLSDKSILTWAIPFTFNGFETVVVILLPAVLPKMLR